LCSFHFLAIYFFLKKYHRIFICILFVWLIGHKQVRNFSHNNFVLLFIWRHYLSWLTLKCVFLVFRAVRAMSESMRQNRLSRGQKDGSLGPSNDSLKHVCSIRLFMSWIIWKYISVVGRVLSLCRPIRLFDFIIPKYLYAMIVVIYYFTLHNMP